MQSVFYKILLVKDVDESAEIEVLEGNSFLISSNKLDLLRKIFGDSITSEGFVNSDTDLVPLIPHNPHKKRESIWEELMGSSVFFSLYNLSNPPVNVQEDEKHFVINNVFTGVLDTVNTVSLICYQLRRILTSKEGIFLQDRKLFIPKGCIR